MKKLLSVAKISLFMVNFLKDFFNKKPLKYGITLLFSISLLSSINSIAKAQTVANPPQDLVETISEIEEAANNRDLDELLEYYSKDFTNTDGLTYTSLSEALKQMWREYPQLRYITLLFSNVRSTNWLNPTNKVLAKTPQYRPQHGGKI